MRAFVAKENAIKADGIAPVSCTRSDVTAQASFALWAERDVLVDEELQMKGG
jgi:hypothetical protein